MMLRDDAERVESFVMEGDVGLADCGGLWLLGKENAAHTAAALQQHLFSSPPPETPARPPVGAQTD